MSRERDPSSGWRTRREAAAPRAPRSWDHRCPAWAARLARSLGGLVLLGLTLVFVASPAAAGDLEELAQRTRPSVVHLLVYDAQGTLRSSGSGFFASADGRIVTNHHVIASASAVRARLADGREVAVRGVLASDEEDDVAVIQAEGSGYVPLTLGTSADLRPGREVVVYGSPAGYEFSLSAGIVSALRDGAAGAPASAPSDKHPSAWAIQTTAAISPGSSGSPLMTLDGTVVGVAVGLHLGGQALNFGVRIERARALLDALPPGAEPRDFLQATGGRSPAFNFAVSMGALAAVVTLWWALGRVRRPASGPTRRRGALPS